MAYGEVEPEGGGREIHQRALFFYADDGLIDSIKTEWTQGVFESLTGMFEQVGVSKNVGKTVGMIYQPCHAV